MLDLYATFDPDELESAKRFYPRWTGRRDKVSVNRQSSDYDHPIRRARTYTAWNTRLRLSPGITDGAPPKRSQRRSRCPPLSTHVRLSDLPDQRLMPTQNSVALWEFMSRFTLPFCSALPHSSPPPSSSTESLPTLSPPPITSTTSIIDLGGVSLGLMWSLRRHLQQASELATAHYPETLHTIAIVNAPTFFPTVWSWIKVLCLFLSSRMLKKDASPLYIYHSLAST